MKVAWSGAAMLIRPRVQVVTCLLVFITCGTVLVMQSDRLWFSNLSLGAPIFNWQYLLMPGSLTQIQTQDHSFETDLVIDEGSLLTAASNPNLKPVPSEKDSVTPQTPTSIQNPTTPEKTAASSSLSSEEASPSADFWSSVKVWDLKDWNVTKPEWVAMSVSVNQSTGYLTCNRDYWLTDICQVSSHVVKVRLNETRVVIFPGDAGLARKRVERIRPLARKFDEGIVRERVTEFELVTQEASAPQPTCDHVSEVPGVLFSAGGHVYSVFHELSDVLIPLFLTTQRYHGEVRLLIADHPADWWYWKWKGFLEMLTNYPILPVARMLEETVRPGNESWCFRSLTVGLEAHNYLTIDPGFSPGRAGLAKMGRMLAEKFGLPVEAEETGEWYDVRKGVSNTTNETLEGDRQLEGSGEGDLGTGLKMGVIRRTDNRMIVNHDRVVEIAREVGFEVQEIEFRYYSPSLKELVQQVRSLDVFFGVHGAAMTHLVFMRPGAVVIQVNPWGIRESVSTVYATPARMHLEYIEYAVHANESSLLDKYAIDDPEIVDPDSLWDQGWEIGGNLYMKQNVVLNENRIGGAFVEAKRRLAASRRLWKAWSEKTRN